jgi:hypothetical protein
MPGGDGVISMSGNFPLLKNLPFSSAEDDPILTILKNPFLFFQWAISFGYEDAGEETIGFLRLYGLHIMEG